METNASFRLTCVTPPKLDGWGRGFFVRPESYVRDIWKQVSTIIAGAVIAAKEYAAQQNHLFGEVSIAFEDSGASTIFALCTPLMRRSHRFSTARDFCFVGAPLSSQIQIFTHVNLCG